MVGAFWDSSWFVPIYAALMAAAVVVGRFLARSEERKLGEPLGADADRRTDRMSARGPLRCAALSSSSGGHRDAASLLP